MGVVWEGDKVIFVDGGIQRAQEIFLSCIFAVVARTKYYSLGNLYKKNVFLTVLETGSSKNGGPDWPRSAERPLPG